MERKTCVFCGTEYSTEMSKCPMCGKSETSAQVEETVRTEEKAGGGWPVWVWGVLCGVLGALVLGGIVFFLVSMGFFGKKEPAPVTPPPAVSEPVEQPPVEEPEEPAEIDLSCTGLTLSQNGFVLDAAGSHVFLTAIPAPMDTSDLIVYTSGDEAIASVEQNGMITAVAPGQTEITVTCGTVSAVCTIVCEFEAEEPEPEEPEKPEEPEEPKEPEVVEPTLSSVDFTLFRPGEQTKLFVKDAPEGAYVTYVSSDSSVVTVDANGTVTAVGSGTATITAVMGDKKFTCIARCNLGDSAETGDGVFFKISSTDVTLFRAGETFTLSITDQDGKSVGVNWHTSNTAVCTVDLNGKVTAVGKGTATISATYNGQTYSCIVRCNF